jgi:hypothetical protein
MADIDLSTQFDKISDKAKIASDKAEGREQQHQRTAGERCNQRSRSRERGGGSTQRQGS